MDRGRESYIWGLKIVISMSDRSEIRLLNGGGGGVHPDN